jgi:hypothetical protein
MVTCSKSHTEGPPRACDVCTPALMPSILLIISERNSAATQFLMVSVEATHWDSYETVLCLTVPNPVRAGRCSPAVSWSININSICVSLKVIIKWTNNLRSPYNGQLYSSPCVSHEGI